MANRGDKAQVIDKTNGMLQTVKAITGANDDEVSSYNHCTSREEVEFDVYCRLTAKGMGEEDAKRKASQIAEVLWQG